MRQWLIALGVAIIGGSIAWAATSKKADHYELRVSATPETPVAGSDAEYVLTIAPNDPYVLKTTTPLKATLTSGEDVELSKTKLTAKDIVDGQAKAKSVSTTFKANSSGGKSIAANLSFFLCTAELCKRHVDTIDFQFEVK